MRTRQNVVNLWNAMVSALRRGSARVKRAVARADSDQTPRRKLGRRAERDAAHYLQQRGYRVLERNFSCREGEIDLVVFRRGVVAFVEVRSRTEPADLDPLHTITRRKQWRVIRAAHRYATLHKLRRKDVTMRFDVMSLRYGPDGEGQGVEHIENAFTA